MPRIESIRPMLAVTDLRRTIEFYTSKLGFVLDATFGDPPVWCEVSRDGRSLTFNAPPRDAVVRDVPRAAKDYQIFYVTTDDVVALHEELRSRGVEVGALRITEYGMKEFEVRDPDDYWLWFAQETNEPPTPERA